MKLIAPKNLFSSIISSVLQDSGIEILYQKSSLLNKDLDYNTSAVTMIPSLELINHRNMFVSQKYAVSFTGALSNSYLYFVNGRKEFKKINLLGDINLNDAVLSKILFMEKYNSEIELIPEIENTIDNTKDYLISGDDNYNNKAFESGISFADLISDMLEMPYVNFIFVSQNKESLMEFNACMENPTERIADIIVPVLEYSNFNNEAGKFIKDNINSVYFDFTVTERNSLKELIKLLFFHGIIDDIFEVKFI